jgi:hypothetical protein
LKGADRLLNYWLRSSPSLGLEASFLLRHLPSAFLLMRQRRVAEGKGLGTGLSTTAKYVRRTASGAAGNGLGTTIKYLRRTRNGAAGSSPGTTTKYL